MSIFHITFNEFVIYYKFAQMRFDFVNITLFSTMGKFSIVVRQVSCLHHCRKSRQSWRAISAQLFSAYDRPSRQAVCSFCKIASHLRFPCSACRHMRQPCSGMFSGIEQVSQKKKRDRHKHGAHGCAVACFRLS